MSLRRSAWLLFFAVLLTFSHLAVARAVLRKPPGSAGLAAPSTLVATAVSSSEIDLNWIDPNASEHRTAIERSLDFSTGFAHIGTVSKNVTSYRDLGLAPSTTYYYRIRAIAPGADFSPYSNTASATTFAVPDTTVPSVPAGLTATAASCSQVNLSWTASTDTGGSGLAGYKVYRNGVQITTTALTSYSNTGLAASTSYAFTVAAYDNAGNTSAQSTAASATTPSCPDTTAPSVPAGLTATASSCSQVNLSWTASTDTGGSGLAGYKVFRGGVQIATTTLTSYSSTGLVGSTSYSYTAAAYDNAGNTSAQSTAASATTTACSIDTTAPSVPTNLKVTAPRCGEIDVSWGPSTDSGGSGLRGYRLYRRDSFYKEVAATVVSSTTTGLAQGEFDYYAISAIDNAGNESSKTAPIGTYAQSCTGVGGDYGWSLTFGPAGPFDIRYGRAAALDSNDNIFLTGYFMGAANFGSGQLTSNGDADVFLAKISSSGSIVWSRSMGGTFSDLGEGVAVDRNGDVLVTGRFQGTVDFGTGNLTSAGGYDIFVAKYSGIDGRPLWTKRIGGTQDDEATAVVTDSASNVIITGQFRGVVDFGGGSVANSSLYSQAFLAKYSGTDGTHIWSKRFGKLDSITPTTLGVGLGAAVDGSDTIAITGYFQGPVDFGGGTLSSAGGVDIYVAKFSAAGVYQWSKGFGDAADQHGTAITTDHSGNLLVTGDFSSSVDFGGGALAATSGAPTIFLAKLSPAGAHVWSKSFVAAGTGNTASLAYGVAVDYNDNVVLTGSVSGNVDFGGGSLSWIGPIFVAKFSSLGTPQWGKDFRGSGPAQGRGIVTDGRGNVIATGYFTTVVDFGGGDLQSYSGVTGGFLVSLRP